MLIYRYSEWDGTQDIPELAADEVMDQLADNLMSYSDLQYSLRQMFQNGLRSGDRRFPGIQDLLSRLRQQRRERLERYDLDSVFDDILRELREIVEQERQAVARQASPETSGRDAQPGEPQGAQPQQQGEKGPGGTEASPSGLSPEEMAGLQKFMQARAQEKQQFLDSLPEDAGGQIKALSDYEFLDPDAQNRFNELLQKLQQQMLDQYFKGLSQAIENLTPEDLARMQEMMRDLNQMLRDRMEGREPDFDEFMRKHGEFFQGMNPQSLDDLIEKLQRQMAAMQSLMDSLSPEMRQSLQDLLSSRIMDPGLRRQMFELGQNLETLFPSRQLRRQYPFHGQENLGLQEAMQLMEQLQRMDDLEKALERTRMGGSLDSIESSDLRELLGDEAADDLDRLKDLVRQL